MSTLIASTFVINNKAYVIHKEMDNKYHIGEKEFESLASAKLYLYFKKKKEKYNKW